MKLTNQPLDPSPVPEASATHESALRDVIFISKATPGDDEFALWLAPKLEAAGYKVFADIVTLNPGDRWRKEITNALQDRAIKMLLCCSDPTLAREGVQEEIGIASDLAKSLKDAKFIIPLRLEQYKKLFGIGELQYIDFVRGWADGLGKLLETLKKQQVPRDIEKFVINPNWEIYRRRNAAPIKHESERLTSNWLRVVDTPDKIFYFEPMGSVDRHTFKRISERSLYPLEIHQNGFFSFQSLAEINSAISTMGRFVVKYEIDLLTFVKEGCEACGIRGKDASNMVHSMFRQAWDKYCRDRGLLEYRYSKGAGFHISEKQAKIGQKVPWGAQGSRRSSMLRNVAKETVWQFGVTTIPAFWPFPHFKLKSRVLFAPFDGKLAGEPFDDAQKQHRLRRSICKGWRNKQWHGRLMAFVELLSGESAFIRLPLGEEAHISLEAAPLLFTSPVSTDLPNHLSDEQEEEDLSTLGRPEPDEEI